VGGILANVFTGMIAETFIDAAYQFDWLSLLVTMVGLRYSPILRHRWPARAFWTSGRSRSWAGE
jgi:hypothetical protein